MITKEYRRKYYQKNKEKIQEQNKRYARKYRIKPETKIKNKEYYRLTVSPKLKKRVEELRRRLGNKCKRCGYSEEIRILEFHHLFNKEFEITTKRGVSEKRMKEELEKCILICPNCHRIIHLNNKQKYVR